MLPRKPNPVDLDVGQLIKKHRLAANLSQTVLAGGIGVTFQQVQKYENGKNRVGAGRLTRIAQVLDVPVTTFFEGGERTAKGTDSPIALLTNPEALRLLQVYSALNDTELRRSILNMVERVAVKTGGHGARRKRRYKSRE